MTEGGTVTPHRLPTFTFKGDTWTVDLRLREFRHLILGQTPEFIPFQSKKGRELLRAYRTSQVVDVVIQQLGSIGLVFPLTKKAKLWINANVSKEDYQAHYQVLVVEHRYLADLARGMKANGLVVNNANQVLEE